MELGIVPVIGDQLKSNQVREVKFPVLRQLAGFGSTYACRNSPVSTDKSAKYQRGNLGICRTIHTKSCARVWKTPTFRRVETVLDILYCLETMRNSITIEVPPALQ